MLITKETEIVIHSTPEAIWDYANDPVNWTASNPQEHLGLEFHNAENRPGTGVTFHQKETVAGLYADLRGHFPYVKRPQLAVWRGVATYRLLGGLLSPRIPEGGVIEIQKTNGGCKLSHNVYMDFPDTLMGRILCWAFRKLFDGPQAVYDHTYRELVFFKKKLET